MKIEPISNLLFENNLKYPTLAILQPTMTPYTALLVQPEATIQVRDDFIRNADRMNAQKLFTAIAQEASARSVELLVTPEYSFPWIAIEELLSNGTTPSTGQLWVLGCESLPIAELHGLQTRFSKWAEVIHEQIVRPQGATTRYLNPMVYIFRTETIDTNAPKVVMVVQFKTAPSGDPQNIEATRMALGNAVYLFEHGNEVRLITLICSDALAFSKKDIDDNYEHLLLLHIQLNDKPRHETYMRYRRQLYELEGDRTEVICLNWAENITFDLHDGSAPVKKANISASAWHSKSAKLATDDVHVEKNHLNGLYYTHDDEQHSHMLHFSYKPAAFLLQASKVRHHAVAAALSRRLGPEVTKVLGWDAAIAAWTEATKPLDDGFNAMTEAYGAPITRLNTCHEVSPLAIERISCIASGDFGPRQDWFKASTLSTTRLEPRTEVVRRVSVAMDPDGKTFRDERVRTIRALVRIPNASLPLPMRMMDLQSGYQFNWSATSPNCNVRSIDADKPATLVYAGDGPLNEDLSRLLAKIRATTSNTPLADRFCLLYRDGQDVKRFDPPLDRSITGADAHPGKNFMEPEK
ncbi:MULTISPECIES: hypothetical protein [unclassified Polaromonas]|uniref:hypothetical protein n=1 Tax=unclassified Polaromonas TaxID=2638319 RepID=UPI0018C95686|nr:MULTISPECIES: hypothetical protein [unclassified Polaromonas]MBG6073921.1 hypothetical protein [Polaromonas sp. CG_9.7]MBG6115900.1 hypothetical protein [Polaromonas sp. CG_9.2]MDH6183325.1 hypothetical protein [Polaromonas sp. CG_23.6]